MANQETLEKLPAAEQADEGADSGREQPERRPRRSIWRWIIPLALLVLVAGAWFVWRTFLAGRESTDDAQVQAHVNSVSAKVGGPITAVKVEDNQEVKQGDLLVQIDPRDYRIALQRAQADLAVAQSGAAAAQTNIPITSTATSTRVSSAEAGVTAARAGTDAARREVDVANAQVAAAQARVREAQANHERTTRDLERMKQLIAKDEISRQQFDAAVAGEAAARASVEAARAAVAQATQQVAVAETHVAQAIAGIGQAEAGLRASQTAPHEVTASRAQASQASSRIEQARAAVAQAELNLSYTSVVAPVNGVAGNKAVEAGQIIQPGQPLLSVIPLNEVWVVANFKETQLRNMRPGQRAKVRVDAYGGREYEGRVQSIAGATGARFSLLPPENATGNFVKVVQRVPVKIVLEGGQDRDQPLRPGMSVDATVFVQ
jgi:membrane fusion protein, multidrug efflux system